MARVGDDAPIQVITDGSEPKHASVPKATLRVSGKSGSSADNGGLREPLIDVQTRYGLTRHFVSQHFIIPGAITIMTVIGDSWLFGRARMGTRHHGHAATEVTRVELLLCKLIHTTRHAGDAAVHAGVGVILGVPYRGSR